MRRFSNQLVGLAFIWAALVVSCGGQDKAAVEDRLDGERLALVWTYQASGSINQPPLRVGDVVVIAPADGPLIALDAESGAPRWEFNPPEGIWERAYAADNETVFVGLGGGQLAALGSRNGQPRWTKDLGSDVQSPPLVMSGVVYVSTTFVGPGLDNDPRGRAKVFALAAADGRELWSFETGNYILQTPFRRGDALYVGGSFDDPADVDEGGHTRIYALAAEDGALRWTYESQDGFVKQLYATDSVLAFVAYQDFITGLDAESGELRWRTEAGNWVPSLSGAGDTIYFGSDNTMVQAISATDGRRLWQYNIGAGVFNYALSAPVRVQDDLYLLTQRGDVVALNAADGTLRWEISTGLKPRVGLTVSRGWLYAGDAEGWVAAYSNR